MTASPDIPGYVSDWFTTRGWRLHDHQRALIRAFRERQSTLLIAPTGAGKTLAGLLPSLIDIHENGEGRLHTLYISPLKALTNDIARNLTAPIEEMGLNVHTESRTGDTPGAKRQRQRRTPPDILLTTPESLMLMLSYTDAPRIFGGVRAVVVDETHSLAATKRGDFTALALARLRQLAPDHVRFGLSATVADPDGLAEWLGSAGEPASVHVAEAAPRPQIQMLRTETPLPYGGFMARYAIPEIYEAVRAAGTSILFVNTRAQAELMLQWLWQANEDALPITVYHGSLDKEQRRKTETMMVDGSLRAVVATSALELGIDWGDVDLVVQVGAPKGVSRLLQRIGRANHRLDEPSRALLVPTNRFETLECLAAIEAIENGVLDGVDDWTATRDTVIQYILNCACAGPVCPNALYGEVTSAAPYADMPRAEFDALFHFAVDGGSVLSNYERYRRLQRGVDGLYRASHQRVARRHRQNIGTIVEASRLRVKKMFGPRGGRVLGEVEEYFAQGLTPGDTFLFAGEVLSFERVRDMTLEARAAKGGEPKVPAYVGGQMPLSTYLAVRVRELFARPDARRHLPTSAQDWLALQEQVSRLPDEDAMLIEHFGRGRLRYTVFYTFEGRKANQTLGMLITRRMERMGLKPMSFVITDYGLTVTNLSTVAEAHIDTILAPDILGDELEEWIAESPMLKRAFRQVATVAGLTEQNYAGERKSMKQVTFSTDLIYDTLRRHEPDHVLLSVTRSEAERELLDLRRLSRMLARVHRNWRFVPLRRASPLAIPMLMQVRAEQVRGSGIEALLAQSALQDEAEKMMEDARAAAG